MRTVALAAALLVAAVLTACGGGNHSSTASSSTASSASSPPTSTPVAASPSTTTTTETTSGRPPEVPTGRGPKHNRGLPPSTNVRIRATFTIKGSRLVPALITAPTGAKIILVVQNDTGRTQRVSLAAARGPVLHPRAHVLAAANPFSLRKGTYRVLLNGRPRAKIVVGALPGP